MIAPRNGKGRGRLPEGRPGRQKTPVHRHHRASHVVGGAGGEQEAARSIARIRFGLMILMPESVAIRPRSKGTDAETGSIHLGAKRAARRVGGVTFFADSSPRTGPRGSAFEHPGMPGQISSDGMRP